MVAVIAVHNLLEPSTDVGNRLVHAAAQFLIACSFATMRFFAVFRQTMNVPLLRRFPRVREAQKGKGLRLSFSTLLPILGDEPLKLDQSCFLRM
jgi:hypothetical protein